MAKIHKLLKNVPIMGTVKYMDFVPEKEVDGKTYSAQISLNGTWDGIGEAKVYLAAPVARAILNDGLAVVKPGTQTDFEWTYRGPVTVLKAEDGKTVRTTVTPAGIAAGATASFATRVVSAVDPALHTTTGHAPAPPDDWAELENRYARCKAIADRVWADYHLTDVAHVAAVATLVIEANKRNLPAPTALGAWDAPPPALAGAVAGTESDGLPF